MSHIDNVTITRTQCRHSSFATLTPPNDAVEWLAYLLSVPEVLDFNLGTETGYPPFCMVFLMLPGNAEIVSLNNDAILPHPEDNKRR